MRDSYSYGNTVSQQRMSTVLRQWIREMMLRGGYGIVFMLALPWLVARELAFANVLTAQAAGVVEERWVDMILEDPSHDLAYHLLGLAELNRGNSDKALRLLEKSIQIRKYVDGKSVAHLWSNFAEALRVSGKLDKALEAIQTGLRIDGENVNTMYNYGVILMDFGDHDNAIVMYRKILAKDPKHELALENLRYSLDRAGRLEELSLLYQWALDMGVAKDRSRTKLDRAITEQRLGKLDNAERLYLDLLAEPAPDDISTWAMQNLGAVYQNQGKFSLAATWYRKVIRSGTRNAGTLNNLGSCLWLLGYQDEGMELFFRALRQDSECVEAYVNLGSAYYQLGEVEKARSAYENALKLKPGLHGLWLRMATLSRPVIECKASIIESRERMRLELMRLEALADQGMLEINNPVAEYERLHFYLVYHGMNERENQERIHRILAKAAQTALKFDYDPIIIRGAKIRVGFVSKFWHENHSHGQLLEGVLAAIRDNPEFQGFVISLPHPRGGPSDNVVSAIGGADRVIELAESFQSMRTSIAKLELDVLIFADTMSEPVTYFLTFARLAPVQAAFWGNPLTTGSPQIDYFISGDWLEQSCAGIGPCGETGSHYLEQLVRLPGSGIWYDEIPLPDNLYAARHRLFATTIPSSAIVFVVAQSVFKLHPAFDEALARIMSNCPDSYVLMLEGREATWTEQLKQRLSNTIKDVQRRIIFTPRVNSSESYLRILACGDVVLHPFPFGGSKTSADAFRVGLPVVTMRGAFLRGRMAAAQYRKMGLDDMVARSVQEYVEIATLLGRNRTRREEITRLIRDRVHLIFNDDQVVQGWLKWIKRAAILDRIHFVRSHEQSLRSLSVVLHEQGRLNEASHLTASLVQAYPKDPSLLNDYGAILHQLGRVHDAIETFEAAVRLKWEFSMAHNNLGVTLQSIGEHEKAQMHYMVALSLHPEWSQPICNLGNSLTQQGRIEESIQHYKSFLSLNELTTEEAAQVACMSLFDLQDKSSVLERIPNSDKVLAIINRGHWNVANNLAKSLMPDEMETFIHGLVPDGTRIQPRTTQGVHIIVQFYLPNKGGALDIVRYKELQSALEANLRNPFVKRVHILSESKLDFGEILSWHGYDHSKIEQRVIGKRLTFSAAFSYANERFPEGEICVLANADIYTDHTIANAHELLELYGNDTHRAFFALLRWEAGDNVSKARRFIPRIDGQDAWVFRTPISVDTKEVDFQLGQLRCDNRLAQVMASNGFNVRNPALDIVTHHLHSASWRSYSEEDNVPGKFMFVRLELPVMR